MTPDGIFIAVDRNTSLSSRIGWLLATAVVVTVILLLTLRSDGAIKAANLVPLRRQFGAVGCLLTGCDTAWEASFFIKDAIGNVALFIPAGVVFAGVPAVVADLRRFWVAVALGAALSLTVEVIQAALPTRATDVDDLLFNTIGAALGAGLLIWYRRSR